MIPTLVPKPFHHPGWIYEGKVDGWRILAYKMARESGSSAAMAPTPTARRGAPTRAPGRGRQPLSVRHAGRYDFGFILRHRGSPKIPVTVGLGRNPGTRYASHSRRSSAQRSYPRRVHGVLLMMGAVALWIVSRLGHR
jgi:hypothetical protein